MRPARPSLPWVASALAGACLLTACSDRCPAPSALDPPRAERLLSLLASVPEGRRLATAVPSPICFHEGPSELVEGAGPRLDARATDPALAARLGHLAFHAHHAIEPGDDCVAYAREMRVGEETAHAIEVRLADLLGAPRPAPPDLDATEASYRSACRPAAR